MTQPDPLRSAVSQLLRLAKEATNGWACYAKRQIEHYEIARLHRDIASIEAIQASSSPQPNGWQPIETAPKDRRIFLGAWFVNNPSRWLEDIGRHETTGGVGEPLKHEWNWRWAGSQPTYWMPLPPPPSALPASLEPEK